MRRWSPWTQRTVNVLADGFPVNFWGTPSMPNQYGDLIMSHILLATAALAWRNHALRRGQPRPYRSGYLRSAIDELVTEFDLVGEYNRLYHPAAV